MAKCRRCDTVLEGRRQLCDPCKAARPGTAKTAKAESEQVDQPAIAVVEHPPGLHRRGKLLWEDLGSTVGTAVGELALEMCRSVDRLDELDRIVAGKGVLQLMKFRLDDHWFDDDGDHHIHVKVGFQSVLMEARLQQGTFKDLLKEFRAVQAVGKSGGSAAPAPSAQPPATGLDEMSQRRAAREQASS
jgi:hypothetical protein